jgi:hypothetical protein
MKRPINLDNLRVATPCPVGWDSMSGTDKVRFCSHCRLNVYNISELTRAEAESLIATTDGRICGRIYRRADGTVITRDCPVGLRALRRRISRRAAAVFALIGTIAGVAAGQKRKHWPREEQVKVAQTVIDSDCDEAELTGLVLDPNGAVIPGALVKLLNRSTHELRQTYSRDEGKFKFSALAPGRYSIQIVAVGFENFSQRSVTFNKDEATAIQVTLKVSQETVIVGAMIAEPTLDITKPGGTTVLKGDFIRNLPLP